MRFSRSGSRNWLWKVWMETMLEKMFFTTSTGNVPLFASSISFAQNTWKRAVCNIEPVSDNLLRSEKVFFFLTVSFKTLYYVKKQKTKQKWNGAFHRVPHLVEQVKSRYVGLLCLQELAGDLKQLLFICLLKTEGTLMGIFTRVVILNNVWSLIN